MTSRAAAIGPTPGTSIRRWLISSCRCQACSRASTRAKPHPELGIVGSQRGEHLLGELRQPIVGGDAHQQRLDLVEPLGCHQPELGGIATDRIAQLRAPVDELIAHAHQHQGRLLLGGLHRHKAHARPAHGLADPVGVGRIVLVALNVGLHQLRRQQHHLVPQRPDLARPVMRRATGLHANPRRRQRLEELEHLAAPQLLAQHRPLGRIHAVQLKNTLGRVYPNANNLAHGRLPRLRSPTDLILAQRCRRGPSTPTCTWKWLRARCVQARAPRWVPNSPSRARWQVHGSRPIPARALRALAAPG